MESDALARQQSSLRNRCQPSSDSVRAAEKLDEERRESGGPWRSNNRPLKIYLRQRSKEERFVGYRRDVHNGASVNPGHFFDDFTFRRYCRPSFGAPQNSVQFHVVLFFLTFVSSRDRRGSIHTIFGCKGIVALQDLGIPIRV